MRQTEQPRSFPPSNRADTFPVEALVSTAAVKTKDFFLASRWPRDWFAQAFVAARAGRWRFQAFAPVPVDPFVASLFSLPLQGSESLWGSQRSAKRKAQSVSYDESNGTNHSHTQNTEHSRETLETKTDYWIFITTSVRYTNEKTPFSFFSFKSK
jgi:hypothetical protein